MTDSKVQPRGLVCEAIYDGSKFRMWKGRDRQNPGREKTFRNLTHRFTWPTENGDELLQVVEWLSPDSTAETLQECGVSYIRGAVYNIKLRGLKEEGGILIAESREIVPVSHQSGVHHEDVAEQPGHAR